MSNLIPERIHVPCPSCTWRGPQWLYADGSCVYCGETWAQEAQDSAWDVVPWEWWLEVGMIRRDELPEVLQFNLSSSPLMVALREKWQTIDAIALMPDSLLPEAEKNPYLSARDLARVKARLAGGNGHKGAEL